MTTTVHTMARKHSTRLTSEQVAEIRAAYADKLFTQVQLATLYDVGQKTISDIVRRTTWSHI